MRTPLLFLLQLAIILLSRPLVAAGKPVPVNVLRARKSRGPQ